MFHFVDDSIVNSQMSREWYDSLIEAGHITNNYELAAKEQGGNGYWADEIIDAMEVFISRN